MGSSSSVIKPEKRITSNQYPTITPNLNKRVNKPYEIAINQYGFSEQQLTISAGELVVFSWANVPDGTFDSSENIRPNEEIYAYSIVQVVDDDVDGKYKPVIGGFHSGKGETKSRFAINIRLKGIYKFKIKNHPKDPPPCVIYVAEEQPYVGQLNDDGFYPRYIKIDEGTTIRWTWSSCSIPHGIYPAEYCDQHNGLYPITKEIGVPKTSDSREIKFSQSGIYYFQTESKTKEQKHVCIVEVVESYRDYNVDVLDSVFSPMMVTIEEGDRVWFSWNKDKCSKKHCIYEIVPPAINHKIDEPFLAVKDGFRWSLPTNNGLMCHRFENCGVYYYSDIIENECASYVGVIVVKPKPANHEVLINEDVVNPDILAVETGDRVWWKWDKQQSVSIVFSDANLLYGKKVDKDKCEIAGENGCEELEENALSRFGLYSLRITKPGVYYYTITNGSKKSMSTIVASPAEKDFKVQITDGDINPKIININPEDRVWFVWENTKKSHNIRQVTHQNQLVTEGFSSGALMDSPGAFVHSFTEPGIYYFRSEGVRNIIGAVVVVPEPSIQVIHISDQHIQPDPIVANVNDAVIWIFQTPQSNELVEINEPKDLLEYQNEPTKIVPRRCLSRSFLVPKVYHFASKSFNRALKKDEKDGNGYKNIVLSSVVVDKKYEYMLVVVDSDGFHPNLINVQKGKSVLFDWKDSNQMHNIVHIKIPADDDKIDVVQGNKAFSSGQPVINNNFLYTFEEAGEYCVASYGATGYYCLIRVLDKASKTATPKFVNKEPHIVSKYHRLHLHCDTTDSQIYYTTNGVQPNKQSPYLKLYDTENGILLTEVGLTIVRAIAMSNDYIMSDIFTSHRFFVADGLNQEGTYKETDVAGENPDWWRTIPRITINDLKNGCVEVLWNSPQLSSQSLISHYQLFLNRVSYKSKIRPNVNRLIVKGLSGAHNYEISLMVYPKQQTLLPQQSNIITLRTSSTIEPGGPIISLRANNRPDQITLVWPSIDSDQIIVDYYQLVINDEKKQMIESRNVYNKVVIDGFEPNLGYSIFIIAVLKNQSIPLISNEIRFKLPLDLNEISLPDVSLRKDNSSLYEEYIEVEEVSKDVIARDPIQKTPLKMSVSPEKTPVTLQKQKDQLQDIKLAVNDLGNGCLILRWDVIPEHFINKVNHYQILFNQVAYRRRIEPNIYQVLVKGLCGGRSYDVKFLVFPKKQDSSTYAESRGLTIKCPRTAVSGGPLISFKANPRPDQITLVWSSINSQANPIEYYNIIIKDDKKQQIKTQMVESVHHTYKVIIDGFKPNFIYNVCVDAIVKDKGILLPSNEIKFKLPLDLSEFSLGFVKTNKDDKDLYDEYIEIDDYGTKEVENLPEPIELDINGIQENLPKPKISASYIKPGAILVEWYLKRLPPNPILLKYYVVSLIGTEFGSSLKSESSYECYMDVNGEKLRAVQHCWIVHDINKYQIEGVIDTSIYQINVAAVFTLDVDDRVTEFKSLSRTITHTSVGPPRAPRLRVTNIDLQAVTLEWIISDYPKPEYITGYRLVINSEYKEKLNPSQHGIVINDLKPGKSYKIELIVLTNSVIGQSEPSKSITVICPTQPKPPVIYPSTTVRANSVMISWNPTTPKTLNKADQIWMYRIFVNGQYHGEIFSSNLSTYSYMISDLAPGQSYDVTVKALCGERIALPSEEDTIYCLIASEFSNSLPVTPTAPPNSPPLKLESIHPNGIDVAWSTPQQYGEATLSGYKLVKNGKVLDTTLSPDTTNATVPGIELGETVTLQIIALTNHPCGHYSALKEHPNYNHDFAISSGGSSMYVNSGNLNSVVKDNVYSACKPGPSLIVKYTGLVIPASKITVEKIAGHSAIITWKIVNHENVHYVVPEYFTISYWPTDRPDNTQTLQTKNDYIEIENLQPSTSYRLAVESRRESKRVYEIIDDNRQPQYTYIYYTRAPSIEFETASPPNAPSNLSLVTSTCHSIKLCWDRPVDNGAELIAIRVDCSPLNMKHTKHIIKEFTPDVTSCEIDNLVEKTKYRVTLTAITEEYFIQHNITELKQLPKRPLEQAPWLASTYVDVMTSGTDNATEIRYKVSHDGKPTIYWREPKVYGTNRLINQTICYHELSSTDKMATQITLPPNAANCKLHDVKIGSKYKVWIEAIVSIKVNLDTDEDTIQKFAHYKEVKDRRTINCVSDAIVMRVPAPCETPILLLNGYSTTTIDLYWAKPSMYSQHVNPLNTEEKYHLYRKLIGYRIEINGMHQKDVDGKENQCVLKNCKPSTVYDIVVVARTCLIDSYTSGELDVGDIDESRSKVLQVKLPSENQLNVLQNFYVKFEESKEGLANNKIRVEWKIPDVSDVAQYNISWFSPQESVTHKKTLDPTTTSCYLPVSKTKSIYEVAIEVMYKSLKSTVSERVNLETPGSPNPPNIWIKEKIDDSTVVVWWSEPRVFPKVQCTGYQLYVNRARYGNKKDADTNFEKLFLKPNKTYEIAVQALTSRTNYGDSDLSNTVNLTTYMPYNESVHNHYEKISALNMFSGESKKNESTSSSFQQLKEHYLHENQKVDGETTLPLKINKISDDTIDLSWNNYIVTDKVNQFKIQWHCLNTNQFEEEQVNENIFAYKIKKCSPGYTYSVRVSALQNMSKVINKSKYILVEMCAPPDTPTLRLRSSNYKSVTIEWNKSNTYGEATISAYKIFIDGKPAAVLAPDQITFTLTNGIPCHEYKFQIQAITDNEDFSSPVSIPFNVVWPGVKHQTLHLLESNSQCVKVGWDDPKISGNMKVSYNRVIATSETTGQMQIQGPFDPNIRECEFRNIDAGRHKIQLEVNAYGFNEPFYSNPIHVDFGFKPDAPFLMINIPALDRRIKLDRIATSMINKRDRLLRIVHNNGMSKQPKELTKAYVEKTLVTLTQLDQALDDCLNYINMLTGYFFVNLSWQCEQSNPAMKIVGYRLYVNGTQYGTDLHESSKHIRIKLSLEKPIYNIYVTTYSNKPFMESDHSNLIQIESEKFLQYSFFCYHCIHLKHVTWPKQGCCNFKESLLYERGYLSQTREPINAGLLANPQPILMCHAVDVRTAKSAYVVENQSKKSSNPKPVTVKVILFWSKWCLSSLRILRLFVNYTKRSMSQYEYIAFHHGNETLDELKDFLKITGYYEANIRYLTDATELLKINALPETSLYDLYSIKGVPYIMVVDHNNLLAWRGRYCCNEYSEFEVFLHHTLSEVIDAKCPVVNCELCIPEVHIDKDFHDLRVEHTYLSQYKETLVKPTNDIWGNQTLMTTKSKSSSSKKPSKKLLTVAERPYSANRLDKNLRYSFRTSSHRFDNEYTQSSLDESGFCYYSKKRHTEKN